MPGTVIGWLIAAILLVVFVAVVFAVVDGV